MSLACLALVALASPCSQEPETTRIHGTVVDAGGAPLEGATLELRGSSIRPRPGGAQGGSGAWADPDPVVTGVDGAFEFEFAPPAEFLFTLAATSAGRADAKWQWSRFVAGRDLDFGAVVLVKEAVIVGYVVDAEGGLLTDGWTVQLLGEPGVQDGRRPTVQYQSVDPDSGRFRFAGLAPGSYSLRASLGSRQASPLTAVAVAGEEVSVSIPYDGPDPARLLEVVVSTAPFASLRLSGSSVVAVAPDGERLRLTRDRRGTSFIREDVEPGDYRIEVRDPRFEPLDLDGVRPGQRATAALVGASTIDVTVIDGEGGDEVVDYDLDVRYVDDGRQVGAARLQSIGSSPRLRGRHAGLVPGDLQLEIQAPGRPAAAATVDDLQAGEVRQVTVVLTRGEALEGVVVDAAGTPLSGVEVQLARGLWPGHDDPGEGARQSQFSTNGQLSMVVIPYRHAATTTDGEGRFRFEGLGTGTHVLLGEMGPKWDVVQRVELVHGSNAPVTLALPRALPVRIRALVPDDWRSGDLSVSLRGSGGADDYSSYAHPWRWLRAGRIPWSEPLDEAATWGPAMLPEGRWHVSLKMSSGSGPRSSSDSIESKSFTVSVEDVTDGDAPIEVQFDLRTTYPTPVEIRMRRPDGDDPFSMFCRLLPRDRPAARSASQSLRTQGGLMVWYGLERPGTYDLVIAGRSSRWRWPEPIDVPRGGEMIVVEPDARWVTARLLDDQGEPLADTALAAWQGDDPPRIAITDEEGRTELFVGDGPLEFARLGPGVATSTLRREIGSASRLSLDVEALDELAREATVAIEPATREVDVRLGGR